MYSIHRGIIFFVCIVYSGRLFSAATNQYCDSAVDQNHFGLSRGTLDSSRLDAGAEVEFTREELTSGLVVSNEQHHSMAIDFNFQYTIFDFDNTLMPMTNGHLHTWDFPVSMRNKGSDYVLSYHLAPAISFSSNVLRDPRLADREGFQLGTGIVYKKDLGLENAWLLGFRSDHRFGHYRGYPVIGFCWRPSRNWQLQLALPDFSIRKSFSNGIHLKLFAEPDGNQWHVFSKDKTTDSDFTYDAIVTGLSVEWHVNASIKLGLDAEKHSRRRFDFVLDDGSVVKTRSKSSTGLTVRGEIVF